LADDMQDIFEALTEPGFIHLRAPALRDLLHWTDADWESFAGTWTDLGPDLYMADGGRYRRRRHAVFAAQDGQIARQPHQPHFQSRDYNPLNGDVQRWFTPIEEETGDGPILQAALRGLTPLFNQLDGRAPDARWHCEVHQFRIETSPAELGRPTPEGLHRDGVDWVLVLLVDRRNVEEGVTEIGDLTGRPLGRFTLSEPGEAVLLDDRKIKHGVTPIVALADAPTGHRDVLVVTWRSEDAENSAHRTAA